MRQTDEFIANVADQIANLKWLNLLFTAISYEDICDPYVQKLIKNMSKSPLITFHLQV